MNRKMTLVLLSMGIVSFAVGGLWEMFDDRTVAAEVNKHADTEVRRELAAAVGVLTNPTSSSAEKAAATKRLIDGRQDELAFLLFRCRLLEFRQEDDVGTPNLQLLIRSMLYVGENYQPRPSMNTLYEPSVVGTIAGLVEKRITAAGVDVSDVVLARSRQSTSVKGEIWAGIEWSERLLRTALIRAPGNAALSRAAEECLNLIEHSRNVLQATVPVANAQAKKPTDPKQVAASVLDNSAGDKAGNLMHERSRAEYPNRWQWAFLLASFAAAAVVGWRFVQSRKS